MSTTTTYDGSHASLQQYLDDAMLNLQHQKGRAVSSGLSCEYRTEDGRACAVGAFIPDEHEVIETKFQGSVTTLSQKYPDLGGIAWPDSEDGLRLANALQQIHDDNRSWEGETFAGHVAINAVAIAFDLDGLY